MSRLAIACCVLSCALLPGSGARAADSQLSEDGVLHRVVSVAWPGGGTALEYKRQSSDGSSQTWTVPGTDDVAEDVEPAIALDPTNRTPVIVWVRDDGAGRDLFATRRANQNGWTEPRRMTATAADERQPRLGVGANHIHLKWGEVSAGGTVFQRSVLDPLTLDTTYGPEVLPVTLDEGLVPPAGETGTSPEPPSGYLYMADVLLGLLPGDAGVAFVWGVRDEPVPIGYYQGFVLPDDIRDPSEITPRWLEGRLTLSFVSEGRFFYLMHSDGRWSDMRIITLDESTNPESALLHVQAMILQEIRLTTTMEGGTP